MATKTYRFVHEGLTASEMTELTGASVTVEMAHPPTYQDVTVEESAFEDLVLAAASKGFTYLETDPPDPAAKTILRSNADQLAADASAVPVASGWIDVVSTTIATKGASSLAIQGTAIGNITLGAAQARVIIDGGSFSAQVLGADSYDLAGISQANTGFNTPCPIPSTGNYTTYTIKMQFRAVGVLASVTPRKGTIIAAFEHKS